MTPSGRKLLKKPSPFTLIATDSGTWIASPASGASDAESLEDLLEDPSTEFEWALWQVDAPIPPRPQWE